MSDERPSPDTDTDFEGFPLTRPEYIGAMVHFYRGELAHADAWRARLDPTTNWAVATGGALVSLAFTSPAHSHVTVLVALVVVSIFMVFEARRYRYFDAWRSRVRLFEINFWVPMLHRDLRSPNPDWREALARDLEHPTFKMSFMQAIGIRLRYNYFWIYLALYFAWLTKLHVHPTPAASYGEVTRRMSIGPIPGGVVLAATLMAFLGALGVALYVGQEHPLEEVRGIDEAVDLWRP